MAQITLEIDDYLDENEFHQSYKTSLAVEVQNGIIHDPASPEFEYSLGSDGWLTDWTGSQWHITSKSLVKITGALFG